MSSLYTPILVVMAAIAGHTDDTHYDTGSAATTSRTGTNLPDAGRV